MSEFVGNNRLGYISCVVSGRSVDLGWVFTAEGATTMWAPPAISIDNNLASSQTRIRIRSTDHKRTRRVNNDLSVLKKLSWHNLTNDFLFNFFAESFQVNVVIVLGRD